MADPRTFVLIGNFEDNITPALGAINNSIAKLKTTVAGLSTKRGGGFGEVTQAVGKLVSSQKHLAESIKTVGQEARTATQALKDYKHTLGQVSSAHYHLAKSGSGFAKSEKKYLEGLTQGVKELKKEYESLGGSTRRRIKAPTLSYGSSASSRQVAPRQVSTGGGGGGVRPPRGGGGEKNFGFEGHMAEFGFAYTLGNAISQPIQNAVVTGFQIGVGMMTKPFQYFAQNLGERMQDEMTDLKAAGGFFSLSKEQTGEKLVNSFDQAVDFTQANNKLLDKIAASLPGSTQDYIEVSKRISDSVARTVIRETIG